MGDARRDFINVICDSPLNEESASHPGSRGRQKGTGIDSDLGWPDKCRWAPPFSALPNSPDQVGRRSPWMLQVVAQRRRPAHALPLSDLAAA